MVLDKIGNTGNVVPSGNVKSSRNTGIKRTTGADSISISREAQNAQEIASNRSIAKKIVKKAPDVRKDKVDSAKQRLSEGYYENDTKILEKVAEKIAEALLR